MPVRYRHGHASVNHDLRSASPLGLAGDLLALSVTSGAFEEKYDAPHERKVPTNGKPCFVLTATGSQVNVRKCRVAASRDNGIAFAKTTRPMRGSVT